MVRRRCQCSKCGSCNTGASLPDKSGNPNRLCSKCKNNLCKSNLRKTYSLRNLCDFKSKTQLHNTKSTSILLSKDRSILRAPDNAMEYISNMSKASNEFVEVIHTKSMGYGLFSVKDLKRRQIILSLNIPIY